MTENEAKAIVNEIAMNYAENGEEEYCEALDTAIKALEEVQKYRTIEKDLKERYHANVDILLLMHHFIETVFEGEEHEGFCLLTNEDREAWEEYRAIGTPEECRAAMEKQTAKKVKSISQVKDGDSYVGLIGRCPCCGDGEQIYDDGRSQGKFEAFGKAIEIVKGGGADA